MLAIVDRFIKGAPFERSGAFVVDGGSRPSNAGPSGRTCDTPVVGVVGDLWRIRDFAEATPSHASRQSINPGYP